jgi:hypothetical protein
VAAATADGVLLQQAPARRRLAGVQDMAGQAGDGIDVPPRLGGHAAEPLKEVEGGALGFEQGTHGAAEGSDRVAGRQAVAVLVVTLKAQLPIHAGQHGLHGRQPCQDAGGARDEGGSSLEVGGDDGLAGKVAFLPQVLCQGPFDQAATGSGFLEGEHGSTPGMLTGSTARRCGKWPGRPPPRPGPGASSGGAAWAARGARGAA